MPRADADTLLGPGVKVMSTAYVRNAIVSWFMRVSCLKINGIE
jgi:hypothetical protein